MLRISMGPDESLDRQYFHKVQVTKISHSSNHLGSNTRDEKGKATYRSCHLNATNNDFTESLHGNSRSPSSNNAPSGLARVTGSTEQKRGSVYQDSTAARKLKEEVSLEGNREIQSSCGSDVDFTFTIIDSLSQPSPNGGSLYTQQKKSPNVSLNADVNSTFSAKNYVLPDRREFLDPSLRLLEDYLSIHNSCSTEGFLEIHPSSEGGQCMSAEIPLKPVKRGFVEKTRFRCDQAIAPESDGNSLLERDIVHTLPKSFSVKVGMPNSPCQLEFDQYEASPKAQISPLRRVFDPFMKSIWQRDSSSVMAKEIAGPRSKALRRSLLNDFSRTAHGHSSQLIKKEKSQPTAPSPAHLHALLRLVDKCGEPFFEFSMTEPEEILGAKAWRADNAFNWVYTFHTLDGKKKSTDTKDRHGSSSMIGQMQVSSYLCSEIRKGASLDNSTVTEFVLYDIARGRNSFAADQETAYCSPSSIEPTRGHVELSDVWHGELPARLASGHVDSDTSVPQPWGYMDLHPYLETTAIVIEVPLEKRKSWRDKTADRVREKEDTHALAPYLVDQWSEDACSNPSPVNVKVITSKGIHGLPCSEEGHPSSLLDRWRSGGGCDCGGWDMGCPIAVFSSQSVEPVTDHSVMENSWPSELFVQGAKERVPALSLTCINDGEYCINFHAQLSTLQAFSICISLVHSVEVTTAIGQERNRQRPQCNSLKLLLEKEVRLLVEAVAEEEKRKATKRVEEIPPYLLLNPPFSPIGRV